MAFEEDTIVAIATPAGAGAIGIVRLSGPSAVAMARQVFRPRSPLEDFQTHRLYLGTLIDPASGAPIDQVLLSCMKAPHSYTREDVVEINCHSGYLLLGKIVEILMRLGARPARPGEFTLRAFLNGRIDLSQAEAVIDLINARSEKGLHLASQELQGSLALEIESMRQKALDLLADLEAVIDFPDEDLPGLSPEEAARRIREDLLRPMETLRASRERRGLWVDGVKTVIVGRVNAGKSSLLNRLLDEERAIVTPVPGTTRDIIESGLVVRGLPLKLMDTAGLRRARTGIEKTGIHLTERKMEEAGLRLVVIDQSRPLNADDLAVLARCRKKAALVVLNKIDLPCRIGKERLERLSSEFPVLRVSALTGEGIEALRDAIVESVVLGDAEDLASRAATGMRHARALEEAARSFERAEKGIMAKAPTEIIASDVRSGLDALGEITGETAVEEVLDRIFSRFCIGK
jgi:tRNA modification GTPase